MLLTQHGWNFPKALVLRPLSCKSNAFADQHSRIQLRWRLWTSPRRFKRRMLSSPRIEVSAKIVRFCCEFCSKGVALRVPYSNLSTVVLDIVWGTGVSKRLLVLFSSSFPWLGAFSAILPLRRSISGRFNWIQATLVPPIVDFFFRLSDITLFLSSLKSSSSGLGAVLHAVEIPAQ